MVGERWGEKLTSVLPFPIRARQSFERDFASLFDIAETRPVHLVAIVSVAAAMLMVWAA